MGMGTSDEVELSAFISHCLALVEGAASLIRQAYDSADVAVQVSPRDQRPLSQSPILQHNSISSLYVL